MKIVILCALIALLFSSLGAEPEPIKASSVKWSEQFGGSETDKHTTFCLMARGFFLSQTKNIGAVTGVWLKKHPNAILVGVSTIQPSIDSDPESKLTFVWVIDGKDSLNFELVRQGCLDPRSQLVVEEPRLKVPRADYDAFVRKLGPAAEFAHQHKLGLLSEPPDADDD